MAQHHLCLRTHLSLISSQQAASAWKAHSTQLWSPCQNCCQDVCCNCLLSERLVTQLLLQVDWFISLLWSGVSAAGLRAIQLHMAATIGSLVCPLAVTWVPQLLMQFCTTSTCKTAAHKHLFWSFGTERESNLSMMPVILVESTWKLLTRGDLVALMHSPCH